MQFGTKDIYCKYFFCFELQVPSYNFREGLITVLYI